MRRKTIGALAIAVAAPLLMADTCSDKSGSTRETRQTQTLQEQAAVVVGMPAVINFTEKRELKRIYELRDDPHYVTYSYYLDLNGGKHKICPTTSIGYPMPYATQFTAPKAPRVVAPVYPDGTTSNWVTEMMDQPEPNGLHMPASADATWVACVGPDNKLAIVYVEPKVLTFPWPMPSVDDPPGK